MTTQTLEWHDGAEISGVCLRTVGTGRQLIVVPGMEGDGTSCLHAVVPVWRELDRSQPTQLVLVDYAREQHATLSGLAETILQLAGHSTPARFVIWGQSFGCLLAASLARQLSPRRLVLVSPFTSLPWSRQFPSTLLRWTPAWLYRRTSLPVSRWVFGPIESPAANAFLRSLQQAAPKDVARRSGWLRESGHRETFANAMQCTRTSVWFGTRDRLVDLRGQIDVFADLMRSATDGPFLIPRSGHVVFPAVSLEFLNQRAVAWLTG